MQESAIAGLEAAVHPLDRGTPAHDGRTFQGPWYPLARETPSVHSKSKRPDAKTMHDAQNRLLDEVVPVWQTVSWVFATVVAAAGCLAWWFGGLAS